MSAELDPLRSYSGPRIDGSPPEHSSGDKTAAPNSQTLAARPLVPPSPASDHSLGLPGDADAESIMECGSMHSTALTLEDAGSGDIADLRDQHVADVAMLVSMVLADIVKKNDEMPFSPDRLTRFHSRAPPQISIRDYIMRIVKFCKVEKAMLLVCVYLSSLFTKSYPRFALNSLTVHRFLITAVTVATKGLCDQFCSNTLYARVGGLSLLELNLLEVEFLVRVQYRVVPPMDALCAIYDSVEAKRASPEFVPVANPTDLDNTNPPNPPKPPKQPPNGALSPVKSAPDPHAAKKAHRSHLFSTKKHSREGQAITEHKTHEETAADGQPRPPGKPSGNKGLKAVKDTFKFLHHSKKK